MDMNLWIITGWRGSGKTTFCREMLHTARAAGWDTAGLLSPACFKDGIKESIWAEDIRSGEKHLLAAIHPRTKNDLAFGEWYFNRKTFEWGNQILQSSIPCDLLVIDELGPLEFYLSMGWVSALDVLKTAQFALVMVVIRPELFENAKKIFYPSHTIQIDGLSEIQNKVHQYTPWLMQLKSGV